MKLLKLSAVRKKPQMPVVSSPKPLIVPDTNVIVSAGTIAQGPPAQVMQAWRGGDIRVATSAPILREVADVLSRPYFVNVSGWTPKRIAIYLDELRGGAHIVPGRTATRVSVDPDDDKLFACAVEAHADYIVSGDEKHVLPVGTYEGIQAISPRDFVDTVLEPRKQAA